MSHDAYTVASKIKSVEETDKTPDSRYRRWKDEITMAEKEFANFQTRGRNTVRRYKDERDSVDGSERKFNIFTTNVEIMKSSLYAKLPKVTVARRFGQANDDPARVASMMLQNAIMQDIDEPECNFGQVMRDAIEDRLVPGMGCAWLRLETDTEEKTLEAQIDPVTGEELQPEATYEEVSRQEVMIDHVFWEDFLYSPCRTWRERRWIARRVYMDQDALVKRFGEDPGKQIPMDYNPRGKDTNSNQPQNDVLQKAMIYEIWDRQERRVLWLSKAWPKLLDEVDDPLKLEDFDPCPKPLFALTTTSNCIAVNDFVICQDQYNELDLVNNRISLLVQACKVVGVYDASASGVQRMLQQGSENSLIPVDNWAIFAEKGGVKGSVDWLPLGEVIAALERLRQARDDIKGQIYELTGISDIVRGNTKASETLGAQNLKAQFASVRIQKMQDEVARFAEEILRLKGEIICRHFVPQQILKLANMEFYQDAQDPQVIQSAVELLKGDHEAFEWRVNVQADSLAMTDYAQQKQEKIEFMNAVATLLQSAATTMKAVPESAPILFESLKFSIAGFKGAQELEGVIDRTLSDIMKSIQEQKQAAQNQPNPEQQKMQMQMQMEQQKMQMEQQKMQMEMEMAQRQAAFDMDMEQRKQASETMADQQKLAYDRETAQMKIDYERQMGEMKLEQMRLEMQIKMRGQIADMEIQEQQRTQDLEAATAMHQEKMNMTRQMHEEKIAAMKAPKTATTSTGKKVSVSSE